MYVETDHVNCTCTCNQCSKGDWGPKGASYLTQSNVYSDVHVEVMVSAGIRINIRQSQNSNISEQSCPVAHRPHWELCTLCMLNCFMLTLSHHPPASTFPPRTACIAM